VDEQAFRERIERGGCLEWAEYGGHLYGTSREAICEPTARGLDVILEVEVQGAAQLRQSLAEAVFVFLIPPSMDVLEQRLRGRGTEDEDVICKRLVRSREEIHLVFEDGDGDSPLGSYEYVIVNGDVDRAVADLLHVVGAARVARQRVVASQRQHFGFD
jgi:guanylate kinase